MKDKIDARIPLLLLIIISLLLANLQINKRLGSERGICYNISSDARGYYAWLPAIFIYHDLNFTFYDTVEIKDATCGLSNGFVQDYRNSFNGRNCDKYYPGISFMLLPFFTAAHLYTRYSSDYAPDGYTPYYFKIVPLAAIAWYFIGMLLFLKILDKLSVDTFRKSITLLLLTFGTNMLYYVIDAPVYSHIYSFALIAAFLYYSFCLSERFSAKNIAILSFITGWIFVARPVNISILLMLPFIFGSGVKPMWNNLITSPAKQAAVLPVLVMPVILCVLYKISTGSYFTYSYGKENFDFLHPHLWQFLFHYNNGLFLYMPLMLIPFLFLKAWYVQEQKSIVWGIIITLAITIYIHSSWSSWHYGFAFGARTMLDFMPLFGIAVGLSLKYANLKKHFYIPLIYLLCCGFTMLLYQQKSVHHMMGVYPITDFWKALRQPFE